MTYVLKLISYFLRCVEVLLCIRKSPYKTHTFPRKKGSCEYYHNREKWHKLYA